MERVMSPDNITLFECSLTDNVSINKGFVITWILHKIFMFYNKVNSVAG